MSLSYQLVVSLTLLSWFENFGALGGSTPVSYPPTPASFFLGGSTLASNTPPMAPTMAPTTFPIVAPASNQGANPNPPQTPIQGAPAGGQTPATSLVSMTTWLSTLLTTAGNLPVMSRPNTSLRTSFPQTGAQAQPTGPDIQAPTTIPSQATSFPNMGLSSLAPVRATRAPTTLPANSTQLPTTPQRCQFTFSTKYETLAETNLDMFVSRTYLLSQLASQCQTSLDRITDVMPSQNSAGYFVLRFSIQEGWPVPLSDALKNLQLAMNTSNFLQVSGIWLGTPAAAVYWKDNGPCPTETCMNGGTCNVTVDDSFTCACVNGYNGDFCHSRPNYALFAILVLLIIPMVVAVIVGFIFGRRRQEKMQLKKAFDLRDVRTIGPRSMLSLPQEPGIRNNMYDTRSFAFAFNDTMFSKSGTVTSSEEPLSAVFNAA